MKTHNFDTPPEKPEEEALPEGLNEAKEEEDFLHLLPESLRGKAGWGDPTPLWQIKPEFVGSRSFPNPVTSLEPKFNKKDWVYASEGPRWLKKALPMDEGGLAQVFEVYDTKLDKILVAKRLRVPINPHTGSDIDYPSVEPDEVLELEALTMERLSHFSRIVPEVYDYTKTLDGKVYIIMEKIEGKSFYEELVRGGLDGVAKVEVLKKVCEGVKVLAEHKVFHGDIKPQNIILDQNRGGEPRLVDFGNASSLGKFAQYTTIETAAPEIFYGGSVKRHTEKSEIYSLGRLAAYVRASIEQSKREEDLKLVEGLRSITEVACMEEPGERYESVGAMIKDVEKVEHA
ncbi:MAG: protein kinase [Patescibacteria group bacterium]